MNHHESSGRESKTRLSRRQFLCRAGAGLAAVHLPAAARAASPSRPRVGAVAYAYNYSLGLFGAYAKRTGEKWDVFKFLEKTREAGGEMAQIYFTMVDKLDEAGLKRVRSQADQLDLRLELHGGGAQRKDFERTLRLASALGVKMVGCSFGMLVRPPRCGTSAARRSIAPSSNRRAKWIGCRTMRTCNWSRTASLAASRI